MKNMDECNVDKWPHLNNSPVIMAIFQVKFQMSSDLSEFDRFDSSIKKVFPKKTKNIQTNLTPKGTPALGISTFTSKADTKVISYTYYSEDQKTKLRLECGSITYTDESEYKGWNEFKSSCLKCLSYIKEIIEHSEIMRLSIRFINKFSMDPFDDPLEYFKTTISTSDNNGLSYPMTKYSFRFIVNVPETNIYSIVNQELETSNKDKFLYIFDIDVLDKTRLIYDEERISSSLEKLREIKNTLFFENITEKTIQLCN